MNSSWAWRGGIAVLIACLPVTARAGDSDVRVSAVGYVTARAKRVSVLGSAPDFTVRRAADGSVAFAGPLPPPSADPDTNTPIAEGEFSALVEPGRFYVDVPGVGRSVDFPIGDDVFRRPFVAAMLGFYGWRCGTAISFAFGGDGFEHAACHLADGALDYLGQPGARRDGTGGWHDAGDYGKYTVNAAFTLGMMLSAFERHKGGLAQAPLPIPEAGGALPDVLDELRWELEWLLKMSYGPDDGRVSHKLTARAFESFVAPEADAQTRYFVPFSTAATADFVAALAQAARIYAPYDPAFAERCLTAARAAYAYLTANPDNTPPEQAAFSTGGYTTSDPDDRLWAAAELWETTGDATPLADVEARIAAALAASPTLVAPDFDWTAVRNLGLFTYLLSTRTGRSPALVEQVRVSAIAAADAVTAAHDASRYGRGVTRYYWGANGSVARTVMMLAVGHRLTDDARYLDVAADQLAYLFGRNQYNRSQVTGLGLSPPRHPHHRPSGADAVTAPYPGLLVGGGTTATDWMDSQELYRVNEVAINWNGALVYALALFLPDGAWPEQVPESDAGAGLTGNPGGDCQSDDGCACAATGSPPAPSTTLPLSFGALLFALRRSRSRSPARLRRPASRRPAQRRSRAPLLRRRWSRARSASWSAPPGRPAARAESPARVRSAPPGRPPPAQWPRTGPA